MICVYCGRVAHRCQCAKPDSPMRRLAERAGRDFEPAWRPEPYKRGVPPQIKQRERRTMQQNYRTWLAELTAQYGAVCLNCGATEVLVLDHVVPIARGGLSEITNLQLLCASCNTLKGKFVWDCRRQKPTEGDS